MGLQILIWQRSKVLISIITLLVHSLFAQEKVALVLSGGGAQGLAHIGFIQALEEMDIPIDFIAGTSAGALVGGLYAAGITPEEMTELSKNGTILNTFLGRIQSEDRPIWERGDTDKGQFTIQRSKGVTTGPDGIINDRLIWQELFMLTAPAMYYADSEFDSLFIPFRAVGSDLIHQHDVVFSNGDLVEAMRISMSLPLFYPPVIKDSIIMVDGGVYNNLPVDVAIQNGADYIIAVNVSDPLPNNNQPGDVFEFFTIFSGTMFAKSDSISITGWNQFANVNTDGFTMFDFAAGDKLIKRGYEAGLRVADEYINYSKRRSEKLHMEQRRQVIRSALNNYQIQSIEVYDEGTKQLIMRKQIRNNGISYYGNSLKYYMQIINNSGYYERAIPRLTNDPSVLQLVVKPSSRIQMVPGLNISSTQGFQLSGNWNYLRSGQVHYRIGAGVGNNSSYVYFRRVPNLILYPDYHPFSSFIDELIHVQYQTLEPIGEPSAIYILKTESNIRYNVVLDWNQQIVFSTGFTADRWQMSDDYAIPVETESIIPSVSISYENEHYNRDGYINMHRVKIEFKQSFRNQNNPYLIAGSVESNLSFAHFKIQPKITGYWQSEIATFVGDLATPMLPLAFYNTHTFRYASNRFITAQIQYSQKLFREDFSFHIDASYYYFRNTIFRDRQGIYGEDLYVRYDSIVGPLEIGWSVLNETENISIKSWTRINIYI